MALKPPLRYSRSVRQTLHWLVEDEWPRRPSDAKGEARHLLCHAERLDQSLRQLPGAGENKRCLVAGSRGIEVPYLCDRLGWEDVTCICAPSGKNGLQSRHSRVHPNADKSYEFELIEHDLESGELPFEAETFGLVVLWGCFEHLRHDPELALYELNRVCEPGATISLVTDNAISLQATHSMLRGQPMPMRLHDPSAEGHWRLYTPPEIAELLAGTGWHVERLTSIVADPPVYWKWWKRWLFKRFVTQYRQGFGLSESFWNAFVFANASKVAGPTRSYPKWLFKDEKIRALKVAMLERVSRKSAAMLSA